MPTIREYAVTKWQSVEAALCLAGGLSNIEKHYDPAILEAASREYRGGIGLREAIEIGAAENGHVSMGSGRDLGEMVRLAFEGHPVLRAAGLSTISLPGVLSNVGNKFLLEAFHTVETGWQRIAKTRPVSDFKQTTSYALTGDLTYEKVGPAGELKHGTLGEQGYTNQAETYGRVLSITRRDLVNDDLSALTDAARKLGRGAAVALNRVFWTTFLAGVGSFWAAGNNNLITGGGSALSSAGLTAANLLFRQQTDPDGNPLAVTPKYLLVPPELEITANELMTSTAVNTGGASSEDRVPDRNIWASKFQVVAPSYLSNANYTGYSTTAWWLLADPLDLPTIEVVFLRGRRDPTLETAQINVQTLGIQFRGFHDFGCALQEKRASVRAAGA